MERGGIRRVARAMQQAGWADQEGASGERSRRERFGTTPTDATGGGRAVTSDLRVRPCLAGGRTWRRCRRWTDRLRPSRGPSRRRSTPAGKVRPGRLGEAFLLTLAVAVGAAATVAVPSVAGSGDRLPPMPHRRTSRRDALTGLPDREAFVDRLDLLLSGQRQLGSAVAVLLLDLDGFKLINHALGHAAGDRLLRDVATRLGACLPPAAVIARFGGDEFAVLIDEVTDPDEPARVATCLIEALRPPFAIDGREAFVTASVGVAASAPHRAEPDDLIREADTALYRAKAAGRDAYHVYAPGMHGPAVARLERETALRRAVDRDELSVEYQPVVDLDSGRIVGVEALLRWSRPGSGEVRPIDFIGIAEETELIGPLGHWILREACRQARQWEDRLPHPPTISVNLSARQLVRPSLVAEVAGALAETGLSPRRLELEVTESVALSAVHGAWATLRSLRQLGVRLAIDDFGTGYSSLDHLRQLAPDALKLDRAFVVGLDDRIDTLPIVRAVTTMAHDLGVVVTAEGIETEDQAARLRSLGIARGQGYLFAAPMVEERIADYLDAASATDAVLEADA